MKVYLGGINSCDVHCENTFLKAHIEGKGHEIVDFFEEADLIIISDTCIGTYHNFLVNMNFLKYVLEEKQTHAQVILSGCLSKGVKFELTEEQKNLLNSVTIVKPESIINYVSNMIGYDVNDEFIKNNSLPFNIDYHQIYTSVVDGCLNHCSFCKSNYMNFDLKSKPFELVENLVKDLNELNSPIYHIGLASSNLTLYGVDLYNEQRAHKVINLMSKVKSLKFMSVGAMINWYPELVEEIVSNPKIKTVFTSLESGSSRVYNLMNRPISLDDLIRVIKFIKKERPDIIINSEFICGFPTETINDLKRTLNLVEELDINPHFIWPYINSLQVPSSNLPQHSKEYLNHLKDYAIQKLMKVKNKFANQLENSEMVVAFKDMQFRCYITILINGGIRYIGFDELDRDYSIGEIIPANTISRTRKL